MAAFRFAGDDLVGNGILIEQAPCSVESMGGNERGKGQDEENWGCVCLRALTWGGGTRGLESRIKCLGTQVSPFPTHCIWILQIFFLKDSHWD